VNPKQQPNIKGGTKESVKKPRIAKNTPLTNKALFVNRIFIALLFFCSQSLIPFALGNLR
jgi:hypothetical protein